ncbi:MBL fold metallo-hydrolase, partial [Candidatus Parcubacteria bacterium]|nr:MBL fold metallo-hydrolase [Candidatus Parcubacteria bacterium]
VVGPLLTNCYLLISSKEAIVIDPGGEIKEILKEIEGKKLKAIILTHYHWDHTLGAKLLKEKTGAPIFIHEKDKEFLKIKADVFLKGGEEIQLGKETLKVLHTPGHSPGSISILGENFIFTGDTLFADGVGRTDLPGGSQKDLEYSLQMLKKIIQPKMKVFPGHGPSFEKK